MRKTYLISLGMLFFSCSQNAFSQEISTQGIDPGSIQQHNIKTIEYQINEKRLLEEQSVKEESTDIIKEMIDEENAPPVPSKIKVLVNKININSSEILTNNEINVLTAKYIRKEVSIDEIKNLLHEINTLYKKKDYITAKAILPPQSIEGGVLHIELVEGRIGKILIEGNKYTKAAYILDKINQESGEILKLKKLEQDIIAFNNNNDVKLQGRIQAGDNYSETDIVLSVRDPNPFHIVPTFDNTGRETIGVLKGGLALSTDSLLGYRDNLTVGTNLARGTTAAFTNYSFPVGNNGTRINGLFSFNHIDIVSGYFKPLNVTGNSFNYGLSLSHPFISNKKFKLSGDIGMNFKESTTYFDGYDLINTPVRTLNAGLNAEIHDKSGIWHVGNNFVQGFDLLGAKQSFFKYEGNIYRVQKITDSITGLFRASTLLSPNDVLPSLEQYQLGGTSTVRGYSEGLLMGSNGYFFSAQVFFPFLFLPEKIYNFPVKDRIKGVLFCDHGAAYPYKPGRSANQYDYLTGAGLGLRINLTKYITGSLDWGFGLGKREIDQPTARFHFGLQSNLL